MPLADETEAEVEYLCLQLELSRTELFLDGDEARVLSGAGLTVLFGSATDSLDMPGNRILLIEAVSETSSSWFFRNAADPVPRSVVCLNHEGSFEARDCAICAREPPFSSPVVELGTVLGDFEALFSEATIDNGRLRAPVEPRDVGRCCQDTEPARDGAIAALGEMLDSLTDFEGDEG